MYIATQRHIFGLGYKPTTKEFKENERKNKEERNSYKKTTLNEYFVKEGDDFPFCGFLEPWINKNDIRLKLGFKIFFDYEFIDYDDPFLVT